LRIRLKATMPPAPAGKPKSVLFPATGRKYCRP
jgi:hypothetical protein